MVEIDKSPNEKIRDEQTNAKWKQIENPCNDSPKSNEMIVEKSTVVEEKKENEVTPKVINGDVPKLNEPQIFPLPQMKIP